MTSKQRILQVGPRRRLETWKLVDRPPAKENRIHYSTGVQVWAFETREPEEPKHSLNLPQPSMWPEHCVLLTGPFYSTADLSGVQYLQPCKVGNIITGLLLHYVAGNCEAIGQVMPGRLLRAVRFDSDFWLELQGSHRCYRVTHAGMEQTGVGDRSHVIELRGFGRLEWWWLPGIARRPYQAQLSYRDRVTPALRWS